MMSFINLKQITPKILKNISFKEYLLYQGFKYVAKKNVGNFKCFVFDKDKNISEVIFLSNEKGKEIYYSIPMGDQGTIIDFVKNRLDKNKEYTLFDPATNTLIEACKTLVIYINQYGENNNKDIDTNNGLTTNIEEIKKITFLKYFKLQKFTDDSFFKHFGISEQISFHPIFKNKIYNAKGLNINNTIYNDIINVAYPMIDTKQNQTGIFYNNIIKLNNNQKEEYTFFSKFTDKSGIWKSNNITLKTNQRRYLTIVSSPKEALAHFELFSDKTIIQYFTFFTINSTSLDHLYQELNSQSSILYLSSNIKIEDLINELKILCYLINYKYDINIEKIDNLYINIKIKITSENQKQYNPFIKKIFAYNKNHVLKTGEILGDSALDHLKNDLMDIKEVNTNKGKYFYIKIPKDTKAIYTFIKILVDSFPLHFNICIEKPKYLTWIKQNQLNLEKNTDLSEEKINKEELVFLHKTR